MGVGQGPQWNVWEDTAVSIAARNQTVNNEVFMMGTVGEQSKTTIVHQSLGHTVQRHMVRNIIRLA